MPVSVEFVPVEGPIFVAIPASFAGAATIPRPWETALSGPRAPLPARRGPRPSPPMGAALPPPVPMPAEALPAGDGHDKFCNNPAPK